MDVSQLLGEPVLAPNVEVVITLLPEMKLSARCPILVALFATGWGSWASLLWPHSVSAFAAQRTILRVPLQ